MHSRHRNFKLPLTAEEKKKISDSFSVVRNLKAEQLLENDRLKKEHDAAILLKKKHDDEHKAGMK